MKRSRWGTGPGLVGLIAGSGLLAVLFVAWWLPMRARERMAANERAAAQALKQLTVAEVDFRSNDRDGNRINDFWVGDVSALHTLADPAAPGNSIRLIPLELARADGRPLAPVPGGPAAYSGYHFVVLRFHHEEGTGKMVPYGYDADGTGGPKVYNNSMFGFCAYPAEYGVTGRHTYIVNEGNTIFKFDMGGKPMLRWPYDEPLRMDYEKLD